MKPINNIIQGSEDELGNRVHKALEETKNPSLVREWEKVYAVCRSFDGLLDHAIRILGKSNLFYK